MHHAPLAQVGLTDVTGGILVLLLAGALALAGLVICVVSAVYRKRILFIVGLALMSPTLALVGYLFWEEIPRSYEWDFSVDRSVARLDEEPVYGRYYYQGNLRTTIRLPGGRGWSGKAGLVTFQAESGQVDSIFWDSRSLSTEETFSEARRILGELRLDDSGLDAWYQAWRPVERSEDPVEDPERSRRERARRGGRVEGRQGTSFHAETPLGSNPRLHLYTRRISPESEEAVWTLHLEVVWPE